MTWRTIVTALVFAVTVFAACTGVDDIRSGISESELIARLGSPDQRVEDEDTIKLYTIGTSCSADVDQILLYKRLIGEDILVGLAPDRRVRCAWDAAVFEFID